MEAINLHVLEPNACAFDEMPHVHDTRKMYALCLRRSVLSSFSGTVTWAILAQGSRPSGGREA